MWVLRFIHILCIRRKTLEKYGVQMVMVFSAQDDPICITDMIKSKDYYITSFGVGDLAVYKYGDIHTPVVRYSIKKKEYLYFCRKCGGRFGVDSLVEEKESDVSGLYWYYCKFCDSCILCVGV